MYPILNGIELNFRFLLIYKVSLRRKNFRIKITNIRLMVYNVIYRERGEKYKLIYIFSLFVVE